MSFSEQGNVQNRRLHDNLQNDLKCPLSLEYFVDPITVPCCGKSFEREYIALHLQSNPRRACPMCGGDLSQFDAAAQAKNIVLAALVSTLQEIENGAPLVQNAPPQEHEWTCTATPIVASNTMCELALNLHNAKFKTRPALFIALLDRSGSMGGAPERQVMAALRHIEALSKTSAHVKLIMLTYGSDCKEISTAAEYKIDGGTNFRAAFAMASTVLQRYICSDEPADAAKNNNVSMATIVLMTDGQDGSGNRQTLVPEFKEMLTARWGRQPIAVHCVGFSGACDRELLESIRTAGTVDGLYRYAEPGDNDDALCQKLSSIFELSSNASSVPVTFQVVNVDKKHEIRFEVNAVKHGSYRCFIDLKSGSQLSLQISSSIDNGVIVPIRILPPSTFVMDRWLSHLVDQLACQVLELSQKASMTHNVRTLCCALLFKNIGAIRSKVSDVNVKVRLDYIAQQVEQLQCGQAVNVGKLSDLRFASMFAPDKPNVAAAQPNLISTQTLQTTQKLVDNKPFSERHLRCYSRNNNGLQRNQLQEAIAVQLTDATSSTVSQLIKQSTVADVQHCDIHGNNTIMLAAYCGHANTLRAIFAKHGYSCVNIDLVNKDGETAATMAIKKRGFHYTLGVLFDAGASLLDRAKSLERYAIENNFNITAQVIAEKGDRVQLGSLAAPANISVDITAKPEYINYMFERALVAPKTTVWDPQQFLNFALAKQMISLVERLINDCGAKPTFTMLLDHCFPKKPDAPDIPIYLQLAQILTAANPTLFSAKTDVEKETALIRATQKGSLPHVQFFADKCANIDEVDEKGNTALWVAAFQCYPCIISDLLDRGANVNLANLKGNAPLYGPCTRGNRKVADQLIGAGARVEQINSNGDTLVLICCRNGHADTLELLLNYVDEEFVNRKAHIDGFNAIMACAEQDKADCIRVLFDYGIKLDQATDDDNAILARATPLHIAAYYGRLAALTALLDLGANPNIADKNGQTALHIAVIQGNVDAIRLLCGKGADKTVADLAGNVPVAYARDRANVRKALVDPVLDILMLLARGGFAKEEEADACSILERYTGVIGCLSTAQVVDVRDLDNSTPLLHAVLHGKVALCKILMQLHADPHLQNSHGMDSATWAIWSKNARLANLFQPSILGQQALQRLDQASAADPTNQQILFLGARPTEYVARTDSGIGQRMQEFISTPVLATDFNVATQVNLLRLEDAKAWAPRKLDNCSFFDDCRGQLAQRVWDAKVFTIGKIGSGFTTLVRETFTLCLATNSTAVYSVVNTALLTGNGLEGAVRFYASALYYSLLNLPAFVGEVFIGSSVAQRKMYTVGQTFRWRHFASASTLWKVALENAPYFTSSARKGIVFIVKSKTGRLIGNNSQFAFDSEVMFLPDTVFRVTNWYHGDVIALGQANIREHTFGVKEVDKERLPLAQLIESDKSLIIEIAEQ